MKSIQINWITMSINNYKGNISSNVVFAINILAISKNFFDKPFSRPGIISFKYKSRFSLIILLPTSPKTRSPLNRLSKCILKTSILIFSGNLLNRTYSTPFSGTRTPRILTKALAFSTNKF